MELQAHSFSNPKRKNMMKTPSSSSSSPSPLSNNASSFEIYEPTEPISTDHDGRLNITSGGRVFPPPITLLRNVKEGQSFAYFRYNMNDKNFIVEEIKIPQTEILRACRKDGRLRLYFAQSCEEDVRESNVVTQVIEKEEEGQKDM